MSKCIWTVMAVASVTFATCDQDPNSPRGFNLPIGDANRGEHVFLQTDSLSRHAIDGIVSGIFFKLAPPINLGSKVPQIRTYDELVTSVINPSHKVAE